MKKDEVFDRIIIDYNNDYDLTAAENEDDINENKVIGDYVTYDKRIGTPLTKIEVDPGWELERITPLEETLLLKLRERFGKRGHSPIPMHDLLAASYQIGDDIGKRFTKFHISSKYLRHLWRYGEITRYVRGRTKWSVKKGRGEWYGVHYKLYPE